MLGIGGAAAAEAAEGFSPSFSFCFKTKFSKSKTAKNLVQAIGKSEYLKLFLQFQVLKTSFCFKAEEEREARAKGPAAQHTVQLYLTATTYS